MLYLCDRCKTCNSTMFVYKTPMHEHTQMCVNMLYQMFEQQCRDTHVWFVCVCAYALQEDRSLRLPLTLSPLEDDICTRCCLFNFEAPFHQEPPKQQLLQYIESFAMESSQSKI